MSESKLSLDDAVNGWLQEKWPALCYDHGRIGWVSNNKHVICIDSEWTCRPIHNIELPSISDPKFFETLNLILVLCVR